MSDERKDGINPQIEAAIRSAKGLRPSAEPELKELTGRMTPDDIVNRAVSRELLARCIPNKPFNVRCPECWGVAWFETIDGLDACETCGGAGRISIVESPAQKPHSLRDRIVMWAAAAALVAAALWICLR